MDKKVLQYVDQKEEFDTVIFQGQVIPVKKYLSIEDISRLLSVYLTEYFDEEEPIETRVMMAEYAFHSNVFEIASGYEVPEDKFMEIANTSLFEDVELKIRNMYEVRELIFNTINKMNTERNTSKKLSELVDRIYSLIDNLSSMPVDEEFLQKITETAKEIKALEIKKETFVPRGKPDESA